MTHRGAREPTVLHGVRASQVRLCPALLRAHTGTPPQTRRVVGWLRLATGMARIFVLGTDRLGRTSKHAHLWMSSIGRYDPRTDRPRRPKIWHQGRSSVSALYLGR